MQLIDLDHRGAALDRPGRLTADRQGALVAALAEVSFAEDAAFDVRAVSLMRSQLGRGEARYSRIASVELAG